MRFYVYAALIGGIGANPERIFFILFDLSLFDHRPPRRLAVVIFFKTLKTMAPQNAILAHLLGGGRLTVNKALSMFRTTELRKVVSRLKRAGHDIRSVWRDDVADGRKVRFKEYFLVKPTL